MDEIIRIRNMSKVFQSSSGEFKALDEINLSVHKGDIYGIIGMSGAGKSTLVRCMNYLERPTQGTVEIDGKDLSSLSNKELRTTRKDIAMIFQQFNLLMQKNVIDNICFPLTIAGMKKKDARKKAIELLEVVGLTEKAKAYPVQLSGGQKQRVAIARALAAEPKILLCDEATSALDPQTTKSILTLLKEINQKYGITIVIITHEMAVVQEICSHVAIIGGGKLVEQGEVFEIFSHPKSQEARELIIKTEGNTTSSTVQKEVEELVTKHCIRIVFTENSSFEPVIANMVIKYQTPVNILKADTKNVGGIAHGEMILGLPEDQEVAEKMKEYLRYRGLEVEEVYDYVG